MLGPVNKLRMLFMPYSIGYMFLNMAKMQVNFIMVDAFKDSKKN